MMFEDGRQRVVRVMREVLARKARCYRTIFSLEGDNALEAERVLADLSRFCRANDTTFDTDERRSILLEGRRQVWLRIAGYLNLDEARVRQLVEVESE